MKSSTKTGYWLCKICRCQKFEKLQNGPATGITHDLSQYTVFQTCSIEIPYTTNSTCSIECESILVLTNFHFPTHLWKNIPNTGHERKQWKRVQFKSTERGEREMTSLRRRCLSLKLDGGGMRVANLHTPGMV